MWQAEDNQQASENAFSNEALARDARYFSKHLELLPGHYTGTDTNRMTLGYFCLGALDLLGILKTATKEKDRLAWIEWIYAQQIHPAEGEQGLKFLEVVLTYHKQYNLISLTFEASVSPHCGFRGAPYAGAAYSPDASTSCNAFDSAHITMTYTALACLLILGDDLSRVNREAIIASMKHLQQPNGSFLPCWQSDECDMRFLYCACAVSYILNDWRGIDVDSAVEYIHDSQTYECGFGQGPNQEAHGGSTYCAIASLCLMNRMDELQRRDELTYWLLTRQRDGFNGRPNKPTDTCYSFWVGASLEMLGGFQFVDTETLRRFLSSTHTKYGGFGKTPGDYPDLLHSYMGLSGLAIAKEAPGLTPLHEALGLSMNTFDHMQRKSIGWKD